MELGLSISRYDKGMRQVSIEKALLAPPDRADSATDFQGISEAHALARSTQPRYQTEEAPALLGKPNVDSCFLI